MLLQTFLQDINTFYLFFFIETGLVTLGSSIWLQILTLLLFSWRSPGRNPLAENAAHTHHPALGSTISAQRSSTSRFLGYQHREKHKKITLKALKNLTKIGFAVPSVTTDGLCTNESFNNFLRDVGPHPEYIKNPYSSHPDVLFTPGTTFCTCLKKRLLL